MKKEGLIKLLKHGRKTQAGKGRFGRNWYERKSNTISKKERCSCCYAHYYNPVHDNEGAMIEHCASDEHILKLVERLGIDDERLLNEISYYMGKILHQERKIDDSLPF